jgi:hypothetical protein
MQAAKNEELQSDMFKKLVSIKNSDMQVLLFMAHMSPCDMQILDGTQI